MDEDAKRRFDAIVQLHDAQWRRITERRAYEMRASYALWAAFGAFAAIVVTNALPVSRWPLFWGVFALGLLLSAIHACWLRGLGNAHDTDRQMAVHYAGILQSLSSSGFATDLQHHLDKQPKWRGLSKDWSRRCQVAVTLALWVAVMLAVVAAAN